MASESGSGDDAKANESTVSHEEAANTTSKAESVKSPPPSPPESGDSDPQAEAELERKLREYSASIREYTLRLLLELNEKKAKNEKLQAERAERHRRRHRTSADARKTNN